jgi:hypothetical protein
MTHAPTSPVDDISRKAKTTLDHQFNPHTPMEKNYGFYSSLIKQLEVHQERDIPVSLFIVDEVKRIFETEEIFSLKMFEDLLRAVNAMGMDHKS